MKKNSFLLGLGISLSIGSSVKAQHSPTHVFVGNGGLFEFSTPYQDYATVGVATFNSGTGLTYDVFDTIYVQSIQDIYASPYMTINTGAVIVAAEDSIVKYDIQSPHTRQGSVHFENIRSVNAFETNNLIVAGRWFGSSDAVGVFDYTTLAPLFTISNADIPYTVHGSAMFGTDSLYIAYNLASTIDACPPYGCYGDSIGMIAVVDVPNQAIVRTINLGTDGAGIRDIHTETNLGVSSSKLHCLATTSGNSIQIDVNTGVKTVTPLGVQRQLNFDLGSFGFNFISSDSVFNLDTVGMVSYTGYQQAGPVSALYDSDFNQFVYTESDFMSFGKLHWLQGNSLDSVDVGISPEHMTFSSNIVLSGVEDVEIVNFNVYPNPNNGQFSISIEEEASYELLSTTGKLVDNGVLNSGINILQLDLPKGMYYFKATTAYASKAKTVIIQ